MNQKNLNYEIETPEERAIEREPILAMNQKNLNYEIETSLMSVSTSLTNTYESKESQL